MHSSEFDAMNRMLPESERHDRALTFFRALAPYKKQEVFDIDFQPVPGQWKA